MVRVDSTPVALVRCRGRAPRLLAVAVVGIFCVAGVRSALRSDAVEPAAINRAPAARDLAAEAFAESFARVYLGWNAAQPERRERALRTFLVESLDPGGGVELPPGSRVGVRWTSVESSVAVDGGRRVTVAAGTTRGDVRVSVVVRRDSRGALGIAEYPAMVGPPATSHRPPITIRETVDDRALAAMARRVVTNYVARERANLAADLTGGGVVVLPQEPLRVLSVESVAWLQKPSRIAITVRARTRDQVHLTLTYDLSVMRRAGRWLVSGVQSPPTSKETP